jgi:uncharacterized membrane protein
MLFGLLQLNVIHPELFGRAFMIAAPLLFMALVLGGTAVFAVRVGLSDKTVTEVEVTSEAVTDYDEDKHWVGGIFYVNRNDPSIFVEKRFGVGWTLNFANPIGYLIVLGPIVLILVLAFVL